MFIDLHGINCFIKVGSAPANAQVKLAMRAVPTGANTVPVSKPFLTFTCRGPNLNMVQDLPISKPHLPAGMPLLPRRVVHPLLPFVPASLKHWILRTFQMTDRDRPPGDGQGHHTSMSILLGSARRGAAHPGDHHQQVANDGPNPDIVFRELPRRSLVPIQEECHIACKFNTSKGAKCIWAWAQWDEDL